MTTVLDYIFKRRSIRKYQDKAVDKETLVKLLEAGMAAPSAANNRPWEFVVVTEPDVMNRLRDRMPYGKYNAPAAIVVCGNPNIGSANPSAFDYWQQDCTAATQNILVAAAGLGLGTVWIGVHPREDRIQGACEAVNLPENVHPLCVIYVGYPAEDQPARTQYDPARVHWENY